MSQYRADGVIRPIDLESIDNKIYEAKKEELKARTIFNVKTDVPAGAETYSYDVIKRSGAAKVLAPGAEDIPLVDADMERHTEKIYSVAAAFRVSVQELRQAQMAGQPIETTKADTARKAIAEKENRIVWIGDAKHNILGVTNAEGIQTIAIDQNKAGTSTKWADKTGKEIVSDLRKARSAVNRLPGHNADTLVVTPDMMEELEKEYNEYTNQTVLQYLRSQNWFSRIEFTSDIKGQGQGDTDCFLVFDSSPDVVEVLIPMDIMRHPEEYKFPNYKIPLEERTGGAIVRYPMAIVRGDGA
ncbi:DUF2184 domain-containing protein [Priestia megaterium]|uniref:Encapsulating for peroxidase family protein n=1 Tax=Priestia megaterium (strain ATCC 14581 / DSM 32 / CCUG 1817 / JCM 2506 / NBRC 15308 / NCIMB 9376 / NCTC 10342 / NRRL B-14308 / VKM B-512 / Ford 19) TaxID=1348623 RepID=A0A0B6AWH9_PRIM2|nr:family 1 encapsulin nanocompartment shell protein [Priestia megaterium]AJI25038.1 encapsulating for peroxidase family protein [Priestia megaterium NBRC 15308 = ATCC 14581]KGJ84228.1 hypothetical protein BMT_13210 [Priestia megaterium NBRC 15308 = ATCC 14581]MDR4230451.1 DUF2184 domain-containing protein [Priestia megaterium]MED3805604.1 family 1 encapsulin nanocompartment shell protein [Priestia megaterium]MED4396318.1 family 1 encapsulin nanocompartment shell protein [Priestia megaterium]